MYWKASWANSSDSIPSVGTATFSRLLLHPIDLAVAVRTATKFSLSAPECLCRRTFDLASAMKAFNFLIWQTYFIETASRLIMFFLSSKTDCLVLRSELVLSLTESLLFLIDRCSCPVCILTRQPFYMTELFALI
jgi:hypothetical protein